MRSEAITETIRLLARLPGLGPRSARRALLYALRKRDTILLPLSKALAVLVDSVCQCTECGAIDTQDPCTLCLDTNRDGSLLCVVEDIGDLWALERTGAYRGLYHILGGTLSALDGVGPEQLGISLLLTRLQGRLDRDRPPVREVILALNATVEAQITAHYLADRLASSDVKITRLARGVPMGSELDYLDDGTLTAALEARLSL